jgi:HK97 family phage major capsid protein
MNPAAVKRERRRRRAVTGAEGDFALQAWFRRKLKMGLKDKHKEAARALDIDPDADELRIRLPERRSLALAPASAGGYAVPEEFGPTIERALVRFSPVREVATVVTTEGGGPMPWPTSNDGQAEAIITTENTSLSTLDVNIGSIVFGSFKFNSKQIIVPVELLEDAAPAFSPWLAKTLAERIALGQNRYFTIGTGAGQPTGAVTAATLGATAASATAITVDDLISLIWSVDPVYRLSENRPALMMHDSIFQTLVKAKDTVGNYLRKGGPDVGNAWQFLGFPLLNNLHMTNVIASGNRTVLFGAWSKYVIRDVREIRFRHLVERYGDTDQDGFVAIMRSDGNLLDAGTHPIKYLVH